MNMPLAVVLGYGLISVIAFLAYVLDKRAARLGRGRTPEIALHLLELLGGWPGALIAQRTVRHKNAKAAYQVVFWLIVALHAAVWVGMWRFRNG